jgi:hypothetical protein
MQKYYQNSQKIKRNKITLKKSQSMNIVKTCTLLFNF